MSHSGSRCYWECFLPASLLLTASFIICYFSWLQLGFPSSCVEICLKLVIAGAQEREGRWGLINKLKMSGFLGKGVRNHLDLISLVRLWFPCLTSPRFLPSIPLVRHLNRLFWNYAHSISLPKQMNDSDFLCFCLAITQNICHVITQVEAEEMSFPSTYMILLQRKLFTYCCNFCSAIQGPTAIFM